MTMRKFIQSLKVADSRGFSLIDVMVSFSLLSIAISALILQHLQQLKSEAGSNLVSQGKQGIHEILSQIEGNVSAFPVIMDETGTPYIYAGCFDDRGSPKADVGGTLVGFGLRLDSDFSSPDGFRERGPVVCPIGEGGIEVRVHVDTTATPQKMDIFAVVLDMDLSGTDARGYSPAVKTFEFNVPNGAEQIPVGPPDPLGLTPVWPLQNR